ncbi:putative C6 transcription factor [Penicillium brasilianum]|uniref:Putative C6 transcription factor n=1 Tax=Penicillium brasilianum TaxID=104259 RepID=A0A1S9RBD4_PENBI|nr:putative C6 transcription factor [Penicillium brasilianum]
MWTLQQETGTRKYISSLEDRIKQLESPQHSERTFGSSQTLHTGLSSLSPTTTHSGTPNESSWSTQYQDRFGHRSRGNATKATPGQNNDGESMRDGVNAMMGAVEEGRASQGFFGTSSAAGFMRQIKTAVDRRVSSPDRRSSAPKIALHSSLLTGQRTERTLSAAPDYVLPPRRMADRLMEVYWDYVFPLYPFVDSAHMKMEYTRVWQGDPLHYDENMVMCTFNVIFALASKLADFIAPEERETSADAYFSRAKGLLQFNLWDTGSAGLIQCLLLMAQYLQSTDYSHQCWICTGLSIRNAQSLGIHLPQTIANLRTPSERQLARKLWHGCVLMDRVISMTFGRPAMISKYSSGAVPLPISVDDEFISAATIAEPSQPVERPSMMVFYAKTLELYEIMNDVLLSLYKPVADEITDDIHDFYFNNTAGEGERTIFELDRSLTRWTRSLPVHLREDSSVFARPDAALPANTYCAARDHLTPHSMISINDSFPRRVALQCSIICVKVAQESIELIYTHVPPDGTGGPLPAWWYNILYIYTAATVLIAGRLSPTILAEISEPSITRSWNCALEILRKYQSHSTSARRCVAALEILYEQVVSEGQPPADTAPGHDLGSNVGHNMNELPFGEVIHAAMMDGFEFPDFQDMSWLNSVPSNLF